MYELVDVTTAREKRQEYMMVSGAFSLNGREYSIKNEHYDERVLVLSFIEKLPESLKQAMAQSLFDQLINHEVYLSTLEW